MAHRGPDTKVVHLITETISGPDVQKLCYPKRKHNFCIMQPNPQFVEPLIALEKYYQSLLDQGYRELATAREQITRHANTLLFEQIADDQEVIESLITMRQQWRKISFDCSSQIDHAREQLTHVNALLADQMVMQLPSLPVSMEALTVNENQNLGLTGTPEIKSDGRGRGGGTRETRETIPPCPPCPDFEASVSSVPAPIVTVQPQPEFNISLADEPDPSEPPTALTTVAPLVQPDPITKSDAIAKGQADSKQLFTLTVPPNLQAVENLLSQKAGAILHRDYILRVLYGELDPDGQQEETATLSEILAQGVEQGLWAEVPDEKDCYTLDLRLVEPELAAKASKQMPSGEPPKSLPRRKLALLPLPNYQHLSLTDAIERVLMENSPQPMNIDTVTQKLFGSIDSAARKSVADLLVKGVIKGRWQRVPGRGVARYTIRLKSQPENRE